jgi:NADPH:quinone reductase-like Zn-dependent oxidoreductase
MKAIVYRNYGSPDVLKCEEIAKPTAGDDEVLVKVCAASVNPLDWHFMRGTPYFVRILAGLRKPKVTRPGVDVAGRKGNTGHRQALHVE